MKLTSVHIENFRSIKHVDIDLADSIVFLGPNNAGKTAILDAIRIALSRKWGQRGTGFTEYDIHLSDENADPKSSPGVLIELKAEERVAGEWPQQIHDDLDKVIQVDPITGRGSVAFQVTYAWSEPDKSYQTVWTFINAARQPLTGSSARRLNLDPFWDYLPMFYLGALRDPGDEFSTRSQFWRRLLRAMEIPQALEARVQSVLDDLNRELLRADPRLVDIATTLSTAAKIGAHGQDASADLRLLPLKSWDLLSKTDIILRNQSGAPWLPLQRQGQGVQSLSVIFLFQAFVKHLLSEIYGPESAPILALEEPETHLHPQAARTLWRQISELPGQKLVATHSPYLVQNTHLRDIRLVRLSDAGTEVRWLAPHFTTEVPFVSELVTIVADSQGRISYDRASSRLTVQGILDETIYRKLLACYAGHADMADVHRRLAALRDSSILYLEDADIKALETYAQRIRGEILFARKWMIVEGQSEYLIVHALGHAVGYDLDQNGVSVIDAVNNGNPPIFSALARAFGIPWLAVLDGDRQGTQYCESLAGRGFEPSEIARRCRTLSAGTLEDQLLNDGLEGEARSILEDLGWADAQTVEATVLRSRMHNPSFAALLSERILRDPGLAGRMPEAFRSAIADMKDLT